MSYEIDKGTLLFTNALTWEEAKDLLEFAEKIVANGYVDLQHPAFQAWSTALGHDGRQQLLVFSTAFPQRALLSLAKLLIPNMPGTQGLISR